MIIEVWHDQYTNSWVIQRKDKEGNQLGNADYVHSKKEGLDYASSYKEGNSEIVVRVFKRNGELQKEIK